MKLRSLTKVNIDEPLPVRGIADADKNTKQIAQWVKKIGEMHRMKPQASVTYTRNMPEIDTLMQEWPAEFEKMLDTEQVSLPSDSHPDFHRLCCLEQT